MESTETKPAELPPFSERAQWLINSVFGGAHHVGAIKKHNEGKRFEYWVFSIYGGASTFDYNHLTNLVIACHDFLIRAEISHSGPRMLKILLSSRFARTGCFSERHPTMEQAIANYRKDVGVAPLMQD